MQKNGKPNHPQTQGKVERFHQTLKRWPAKQPSAVTIEELQYQIDRFRDAYNDKRPHRELARRTPTDVYAALPKAAPDSAANGHYRLRYDRVDDWGRISMRRAATMHHLAIGYAHRGERVLAIADDTTITVTDLETGAILPTHHINPTKHYWRNTQGAPGRWPGAQ